MGWFNAPMSGMIPLKLVVGANSVTRFGLSEKRETEISPESEGLLSRCRDRNLDEALLG